jgi:hypothetical protein
LAVVGIECIRNSTSDNSSIHSSALTVSRIFAQCHGSISSTLERDWIIPFVELEELREIFIFKAVSYGPTASEIAFVVERATVVCWQWIIKDRLTGII